MSNKYPGGIISLGGPESNSNYFNGGNYLSLPANAAFTFGTGDFTVEGWIYPTSTAGTANGAFQQGTSFPVNSTTNTVAFGTVNAGQVWQIYAKNTNTNSTATWSLNTWYHFAVVRSSGTTTAYVNGFAVITVTSDTTDYTGTYFGIGAIYSSVGYCFGNISNLRVTKGGALYTANFAPPTGPLTTTVIAGTVSLLTCQSPSFVDNSSNAFAITNTNSVTISANTPFTAYNPNTLNPALGAATNGVWTLDQALAAEVTRSWPMYDPYYNQVVLNLHGNGTNGAQNNTFLDSSSNNFTITRNGNATQGAFTPYSQYGSVYYGSGNYWQVPQSTNWDITGAAFTVECFVYLTGYTGDSNQGVALVGNFTGSNGGAGWQMGLTYGATPTLGLSYWNGGGGTSFGYTGTAVALNQWTHLAMTRSGSTIYLYVNGQCVYSGAAPSIGAGDKLTSGAYVQNLSYPSYVYGYISNLRIVKGTALYSGTGSFTVPTSRLTAVTNTVFLGNQSNRFVDNSGTAGAFSFGGTPSIQNFQPFLQNLPYESSRLGGSGYFDGSGDYLSGSITAIGTNDFTIEYYSYLTAHSGTNGEGGYFQISGASGGLDTTFSVGVIAARASSGSGRVLSINVGGTSISTTYVPQLNEWFHTAIVRQSNSVKIYVNGVLVSTPTTVSTNLTGAYVALGGYYSTSYLMTGYLSGFRVVNSAVYTGAFTPPTLPLQTSGAASAAAYPSTTNVNTSFSSSATSLLTNYTNGAIYDNAAMNDLETVGNAQISTSVKKYGTGSMAFDGTGDYLKASNTPVCVLANGDFTIEMWVYPTTTGTLRRLIGWQNGSASNSNYSYAVNIDSSNKASGQLFDGTTQYVSTSSASVTQNAWNHIAFVRSGTSAKVYLNGVGATAITPSTFNTIANGSLYVGYDADGSSYPFTGYIDDLRITKGVARYTGTFTPPTSQLQDQ